MLAKAFGEKSSQWREPPQLCVGIGRLGDGLRVGWFRLSRNPLSRGSENLCPELSLVPTSSLYWWAEPTMPVSCSTSCLLGQVQHRYPSSVFQMPGLDTAGTGSLHLQSLVWGQGEASGFLGSVPYPPHSVHFNAAQWDAAAVLVDPHWWAGGQDPADKLGI